MNNFEGTKKKVKILTFVFLGIFLVILVNFIIHINHVKKYNETERTVDANSNNTDVLVDIHPRGQTTDSWEKVDAFPDMVIYAKIYEATISNNSKALMDDWALKINITQDCWINNAWNGTVEIHQFDGGEEKVQRLSLQNYNVDDLVINYNLCGQDLLIPLEEGDYIVYYPSTDPSTSEEEIKSTQDYNGSVSPGLIFYGKEENVDLLHFELHYKLNKSIWDGTEPKIFMILLPLWFILLLIFVIVSFITIRFEKRIATQSIITSDFLEVFVDYIDSKENKTEGHSKMVAEYAKKIVKELGMSEKDSDNVYYAALLHDIGKCYVPDYILKKTQPLTKEETETKQQHTVKGAEMLSKCATIQGAHDGALYHHERYDGTGYPTGKSGEDIPLIGRVIALCNDYAKKLAEAGGNEEFVSQRVFAELEKEKGTAYDPVLVETLQDIINKKTV